jgi:squalene/oxidosqualene cyclase-like protein
VSSLPETRPDALSSAIDVLRRHQAPSGALPGDYSGPLFLLPMYVGACYATGEMPTREVQDQMVHYLRDVQNPDGGFGLGEQNPSCVFTSVLNYVALRLLGVPADDPVAARTRAWFSEHGGALGAASWGRFYLCILNLHSWEGLNPVQPELWLLPYSVPVHPGRMWCHARMVYLPMSWLYGRRATVPLTPLLQDIRSEIYLQPYDSIHWPSVRNSVDPVDAYTPHTTPLKIAHRFLIAAEAVMPQWLRDRALAEVEHQVMYEDDITNHVCIGPVNKVYDTLLWHFKDPGGERVRKHLARLPDYLHTDARGTRMNGYNNSQLWDTAFAVQALLATGRDDEALDVAERCFDYVRDVQIPEDPHDRQRHYRCHSKGGWPFSNLEHGWPITDCTSEGLKVALLMASRTKHPLPEAKLAKAVETILRWQNEDGGWASYEQTRAPAWLEWFNPSDIFGDIMIDYSYVECTSACLQALSAWQSRPGATPDPTIDYAIKQGRDFILSKQRPDGSWFGSWGVCYTYGTWFGIEGLRASGLPASHPAIQRAADYLESIQLEDGGWGEHITSCAVGHTVRTERSQSVMTSWALLALMEADRRHADSAERGFDFLRRAQHADGTWHDDAIAGVFNKTCSIRYDNYVRIFPLWALGRAASEA